MINMAIIPQIRFKLFFLVREFTLWKLRRLYGMHIGKDVKINRKANHKYAVLTITSTKYAMSG